MLTPARPFVAASLFLVVTVGAAEAAEPTRTTSGTEAAAQRAPAEETRVLRLAVKGMVSKNCPVLVKGGLSRLPGVVRVEASLEEKSAEVVYAPSQVSEETLLRVLKDDVGFTAVPVRETRFAIQGMVTPNCPALVKRAAAKIPGVKRASASLDDKSATIEWLEGSTTPTAIAKVIKDQTGFDARPQP